jgi:hypothetical protein
LQLLCQRHEKIFYVASYLYSMIYESVSLPGADLPAGRGMGERANRAEFYPAGMKKPGSAD